MGKGSFACVYRAKSVKTGLEVAIKTVRIHLSPVSQQTSKLSSVVCSWDWSTIRGSQPPPRDSMWSLDSPQMSSQWLSLVERQIDCFHCSTLYMLQQGV